jgi:RNA polymerase sigma factor FliA
MTEDELNLWKRYRQGDIEAREALVFLHLRLVKLWVNLLQRSVSWVDREVLMSEGTIGLLRAIDRFDYDRGLEFTTFARYEIRGAILASPEVTRGVPRGPYKNYRKIRKALDELFVRLERKPTIDEVAEESGLTLSEVKDALNGVHIAFTCGFGDNTGDSESDSDPDEGLQARSSAVGSTRSDQPWDRVNETIRIDKALSSLSERESSIVRGYYWHDRTDAEIAGQLGLTLVNTRRIRLKALEKLADMLGDQEEVQR